MRKCKRRDWAHLSDYEYAHRYYCYNSETGELSFREDTNLSRAGDLCHGKGTNGHYYARFRGTKVLGVHRIIWLMVKGEWAQKDIDHIDCNPKNNRIENLREATPSQNGANRRIHRNNRSGYKGVWRSTGPCKWRAGIVVNRRVIMLGHFDDPYEAHLAYMEAAKKYFGEFARAA